MKITETFLSLYREYETLVRNKGLDPKDYETQVDETTGARLSMCRQFRNYLSHKNDPGFLEISQAQVKFLQKQIQTLQQEDDILKKHIKATATGITVPTEKCGDVLQRFAKLRPTHVVVMTGKDTYALAEVYDIALQATAGKTNKIDSCKLITKGLLFASPTDKMADLPTGNIIICTQDGSASGKLLGVYYPKH